MTTYYPMYDPEDVRPERLTRCAFKYRPSFADHAGPNLGDRHRGTLGHDWHEGREAEEHQAHQRDSRARDRHRR